MDSRERAALEAMAEDCASCQKALAAGTPAQAFVITPDEPLDPWAKPARRPLPEHHWVGHEDCDDPGEDEYHLINNHGRIFLLAEISDPENSYEFDQAAIVELDGIYYLCQATGDSDELPESNWCVQEQNTDPIELMRVIWNGKYTGLAYKATQLGMLLAALGAESREARTAFLALGPSSSKKP
jgi:hypothetical protein